MKKLDKTITMLYATRTQHLRPESAYQVLARANQLEAEGREIIHFEIGQPDYATFENVRQALKQFAPGTPVILHQPV